MGIYIKGMEMPKDPFYPVHATIYADGTVITGHGIGESAKEAVPVPPHGRLIDADALEYMELETCDTDDWHLIRERIRGRNSIRRIIKNAPTVIPAEEEQQK